MLEFTDAYGTPAKEGYQATKRPAMTSTPTLKGRPRYRLKDQWARYTVDVSIVMTEAKFRGWVTFWGQINNGADWFIMPLMLDLNDIYASGAEKYPVHALSAYSASVDEFRLWTVSLQLEVQADGVFPETLCDDIYGGPIDGLSADSIYGGPIDGLATDVIAPCPYVEPANA